MAKLSDYLEDALLDAVLRNTAYSSPATVYLALFSTATTDAGGGTEVVGGSYARQAVTFGAPSAGSCSNTANVEFTNMPAVTVSHVAVCDASNGGNFLFHGALDSSVAVTAGNTFRVSTGNLTCTLD